MVQWIFEILSRKEGRVRPSPRLPSLAPPGCRDSWHEPVLPAFRAQFGIYAAAAQAELTNTEDFHALTAAGDGGNWSNLHKDEAFRGAAGDGLVLNPAARNPNEEAGIPPSPSGDEPGPVKASAPSYIGWRLQDALSAALKDEAWDAGCTWTAPVSGPAVVSIPVSQAQLPEPLCKLIPRRDIPPAHILSDSSSGQEPEAGV